MCVNNYVELKVEQKGKVKIELFYVIANDKIRIILICNKTLRELDKVEKQKEKISGECEIETVNSAQSAIIEVSGDKKIENF